MTTPPGRESAVQVLPLLTLTWIVLAATALFYVLVLRTSIEPSSWTSWLWFAAVVCIAGLGVGLARLWATQEARRKWLGRR